MNGLEIKITCNDKRLKKLAESTNFIEGQSGLIQPVDRKYKEHGTNREEHIEFKNDNCSHALRTNVIPVTAVGEPKVEVIGNYMPSGHDASRIVDSDGLAPTVKENHGTVTAVVEKQRKDIKEIEKYCEYCGKQLQRKRFNGRLEDFTVFSNRKYCNRECMKRAYLKIGEYSQNWSNAHTTARKINELILHKEVCELCGSDANLDIHHIDGNWQNNNLDNLMCLCRSCHTKYEKNKNNADIGLRIRKLTPRETWRLMGFDDEDFEKAEKVNSNTQLYKQARKLNCG